MGGSTLDRVIEIAKHCSGTGSLDANSAVDQDMRISGEDVTWFAMELAKEFGDDIYKWPWDRFALLSEGLGCLFVPALIWQLASWPFRGSFQYPSTYERLELGHIAAVIEKGEWFDP
jgi:hypothetical protein